MSLFKKQKQTHRFQKQTYGYQGKCWGGGGGGIHQELGINIHILIYKISQQGCIYHRDQTPVPLLPIGKESGKGWTHVHV